MADFRKWILALSVLALVFTGVASAQVNTGSSAISCTASAAVPPQLRTEGYTELVGDIQLFCNGGVAPLLGNLIPQANIVVQLPGTITSRLIGKNAQAGSEALLMIDEPGSTSAGGYGPTLPQILCTTPLTGCQAYVGQVTVGPNTYMTPVTTIGGTVNAPNVYYGESSGQTVTFFGVPILAPVTTGLQREYRITNIRVNANGITGGGSNFTNVLANVSFNNVQVTITNPNPTVGYIQQSLSASFRNGGYYNSSPAGNTTAVSTANLYQCTAETNYPVAFLRFTELFGTAFKTRVNGSTPGSGAGAYPNTVKSSGSFAVQNIPGGQYNAESDFTSLFNGTADTAVALNANAGAGLADYGTRLKAVFSNLPGGVSVYVSTTNVNDGANTNTLTNGTPEPSGVFPPNGGAALNAAVSPELAALVPSEAAIDADGSVNPVAATIAGTAGFPGLYQLTPSSSGGATAVWEVIQTLPNTNESYDFGVYVTYPAGLTPVSGVTAALSYAPTPTVPFSATDAGKASGSLTIPRFAPNPTASGTSFLNIVACNTVLLFPYVTTAMLVAGQSGFDTGISIANTSTDPFNTPTSSGLCSLYWYGGTPGSITATATNPQTSVLGAGGVNSNVPIISGTTALTLASQSVPAGWSGYMIASCNFQFAHGYAAVSDVGVRNIMASYLALIIGNASSTLRNVPVGLSGVCVFG
jgi:hypothetical protein